uniref:Uncharacterized protein n=1 Tax=Arundo donax TaxID=35708 RepID=A0A0A9BDZ5_ARUDO
MPANIKAKSLTGGHATNPAQLFSFSPR